LYRPEVAAYLANQYVAAEMFVHSLDDRSNGVSGTTVNGDGSSRPGSVWLRVEGRNEGTDSSDGTFHVNTDSFLMQGGVEVAQKKLTPGADLLHLGLMATYQTAQSNADAAGNPASASGNVAGYSVGAYGTWYQNDASRLGAYADTWLQYGWFNNSVSGSELPKVNYNAHGGAISGELGYAVPLVGEWAIVPQGQLIYVDYLQDSFTEPNGTRINDADSSGVITRLGLRLQRTFQRSAAEKMQFYVTANWWHTTVDSSTSFNQIPEGSLYPANRYEVKLGLNGNLGRSWNAWGNVSGVWGAQSYHTYVLRAGVKYAW
jgi:outer membrane autotransporter protein